MTTKAEREAAYQALVKRGVPIPPEEIDAVLEAAEGARGAVSTQMAEVPLARDIWAATKASAPLARQTQMPEEVKAALIHMEFIAVAQDGRGTTETAAATRAHITVLSAHIDILTQKVAEAERERDEWKETAVSAQERATAALSRPSPGPATETDRKDGNDVKEMFGFEIARKIEAVRMAAYDDSGNEPSRSVLNRAIDNLYDAVGALLASVRPKAEGV